MNGRNPWGDIRGPYEEYGVQTPMDDERAAYSKELPSEVKKVEYSAPPMKNKRNKGGWYYLTKTGDLVPATTGISIFERTSNAIRRNKWGQ